MHLRTSCGRHKRFSQNWQSHMQMKEKKCEKAAAAPRRRRSRNKFEIINQINKWIKSNMSHLCWMISAHWINLHTRPLPFRCLCGASGTNALAHLYEDVWRSWPCRAARYTPEQRRPSQRINAWNVLLNRINFMIMWHWQSARRNGYRYNGSV